MKGHKLSLEIYSVLKKEEHKIFSEVMLEKKIPMPNFNIQFCPTADILININGKKALIEVDDDSDPGRSITKYWPLLHYYKDSELKNYDLIFIEVFRKGSTFGGGYKALAEFIGERFNEYYPKFYKFYLIDAYNREVDNIVSEIAERLKGSY